MLAMVTLMLATFVPTRLTNVRTQAAKSRSKLRFTAHKGACLPASVRTISVPPDAFGHHGDVILGQACLGTLIAHLSAIITRIDTVLVLAGGHGASPVLN
jgi:hypothetical protein